MRGNWIGITEVEARPEPVVVDAPPMAPEALAHWETILTSVRERKPSVASIFEHAAAVEVARERLVLAYPPGSFLAEQANEAETQNLLREAASAHFGAPCALEIDTTGRHLAVQSLAAKNSAAQAARIADAKRKVAEHPLVLAAVNVLGAELRDVRLPADFC
jgi:hypothetical protein